MSPPCDLGTAPYLTLVFYPFQGKVLEALDRELLTQQTLVYFTSDNGGRREARQGGTRVGGWNGVYRGEGAPCMHCRRISRVSKPACADLAAVTKSPEPWRRPLAFSSQEEAAPEAGRAECVCLGSSGGQRCWRPGESLTSPRASWTCSPRWVTWAEGPSPGTGGRDPESSGRASDFSETVGVS